MMINTPHQQAGVTLIEVLVGIFLGLLVVGVALGSLLVSRGFTAATVDASSLQQQASLAFRVIGQQIRQAGSLRLDLDVTNRDKNPTDVLDIDAVSGLTVGYNNYNQIVSGMDNPGPGEYQFSIGYENYAERTKAIANNQPASTLFRNCLGNGGGLDVGTGQVDVSMLVSHFRYDSNSGSLMCAGVGSNGNMVEQPVIGNVAGLGVTYYVQDAASVASGNPTVLTTVGADALTASNGWPNVVALEVCLDMVGSVRTDIPAGMTYTGCDGQQKNYDGRAHMVYRNVFNIRSQGVLN